MVNTDRASRPFDLGGNPQSGPRTVRNHSGYPMPVYGDVDRFVTALGQIIGLDYARDAMMRSSRWAG